MGCTCYFGIAKYVLFCSNLLFVLLGLGLIVAGSFAYNNVQFTSDALPKAYQSAKAVPIATIVIGCITFVVAFMGCWGAIRENICLLIVFAIILIIMLVIQLSFSVTAFVLVKGRDTWEKDLSTKFKELIGNYNNTEKPSNLIIDVIQSKAKCCGADAATDYQKGKIPKSCCEKGENPLTCTVYKDGCVKRIFDYLRTAAHSMGSVLLVACAIEAVSAIYAAFLVCSISSGVP